MQVVDLYCGLGGFSAGAIDAGAEVVLGIDSDSVPLKLWGANVPGGQGRLSESDDGRSPRYRRATVRSALLDF